MMMKSCWQAGSTTAINSQSTTIVRRFVGGGAPLARRNVCTVTTTTFTTTRAPVRLLRDDTWIATCRPCRLPSTTPSLSLGRSCCELSSPLQTRYFSNTNTTDNDDGGDSTTTTTTSTPSDSDTNTDSIQITSNTDTVSLEIPGTTVGKGRKLAIVYTCTVCETRSAKQFTENAYLHGVVMVRCPGCKNLHLIADRLVWFDDTDSQHFDLSSLERMTGQKVKRVGDDNVWEVSLEDLVGKDKMRKILNMEQQQHHQQDEDETKSP